MTLFALGAKWGARPSARTAELQKSSRSRLPRAMVPMPKPACRKKCRRVTAFRISVRSFLLRARTVLLLGQGLVQVQDHVGHHGPRGPLGRIRRTALVAGRAAAAGSRKAHDGPSRFRIAAQPLELLLAEGEEPGPLVGPGRPGDAEPERVVGSLPGCGPRLAQHAPGQGPRGREERGVVQGG